MVKVAGIYFQVQQMAFTVEEFVGGETVNIKVPHDGRLLLFGQVVVGYGRHPPQ